jgi:uncharacterized protein (TIGR02444 family)
MTARDADAFWNFSLRVYRAPGVKDACLRLQDEAGLDVNVLLYCLWRGARGVRLDPSELKRRLAALEPWATQAIAPLRALRRTLRAPAFGLPTEPARDLGARLLALELDAERTAQRLLVEAAPEPAAELPPDDAVDGNIQLYLGIAGAAVSSDVITLLAGSALREYNN